jgi:hypothetical protein
MPTKQLNTAIAALLVSAFSVSANAALVSVLGGTAIYDSDQNLSWLSNANAGAGSSFDDGSNTVDGRMSWVNANNWAASLSINGYDNWRLPDMDADNDGVLVDCSAASAALCLDNEYGYHFHFNGIDATNSGDFSAVQTNNYWSNTAASAAEAWLFDFTFNDGSQIATSKNLNASAWAVHEGNVGLVPLPGAVWMFGSALAGIGAMRRRRTGA